MKTQRPAKHQHHAFSKTFFLLLSEAFCALLCTHNCFYKSSVIRLTQCLGLILYSDFSLILVVFSSVSLVKLHNWVACWKTFITFVGRKVNHWGVEVDLEVRILNISKVGSSVADWHRTLKLLAYFQHGVYKECTLGGWSLEETLAYWNLFSLQKSCRKMQVTGRPVK